MTQRGQRRVSFVAGFSDQGGMQADFDTKMAEAALNMAWDVTSDSFPAVEKQIDRILTCDKQGLADLQLLTRLARWAFDYEADPHLMAINLAYQLSATAAPTGVPANQVQHIVVVGTGGFYKLKLQVGAHVKETPPIAFDATATAIQRAIQNLTAIGRGNATVVSSSGFNVTILGSLLHHEIGLLTADVSGLLGGSPSVTITETTAGVERAHVFNQTTGFQPAPFGIATGYRGSPNPIRRFNSLVSDTVRIAGSRATPKITANWGVVGSAEPDFTSGSYALPACQTFRAARFLDCGLLIDGVDYMLSEQWRDFEVQHNNGTVTDEDAYTGQDEDIHRAERADYRTLVINAGITGEEGDDIYNLADSLGHAEVALRIGRVGKAIYYDIPEAVFQFNGTPVTPDGTNRRTKINLQIEAIGDPATAFTVTAEDNQSETFLTIQ